MKKASGKLKKYLELIENDNTTHENFWEATILEFKSLIQ
jgi:hypothetical protein